MILCFKPQTTIYNLHNQTTLTNKEKADRIVESEKEEGKIAGRENLKEIWKEINKGADQEIGMSQLDRSSVGQYKTSLILVSS